MTIFFSNVIITLDGVFYMKKNYLKVISLSLLMGTITFSNVGCNSGKVKVTFVTENNSDIVRYIKKGKTLVDIPEVPSVKGKYCLWEEKDFKNIKEDMIVNALCYSTVTNLSTNIPDEIDVEVSSSEADLEYIFKDIELEATYESGETKKIYKGDYKIIANDYNKDVSGTYTVSVAYNNAKQDITINVHKIDDYVTVSLNGQNGYYNEGLPKLIANTTVDGYVSFDKGQSLAIGTKSYSWTFTPTDTIKYAVVHGNINVTLVNANKIIANKTVVDVEYGATKEEVIEIIKEGLVVEGKYGNIYREIDSQYYTITSDDFIVNTSDTFTFKVSYDELVFTTIEVNVGKCETYTLNVEGIDELIIKDVVTLDDVKDDLFYQTSINGKLSFKEGQQLVLGDYEYTYVFTPDNINYAVKEGKVRIHVYQVMELDFTIEDEFKYGTAREKIIDSLLLSISGSAIYNDSLTKELKPSNITINIENYNKLEAGEYQYTVDYNGELSVTRYFTLNKRELKAGLDYEISCQAVDPNNYENMPICKIIKKDTTEFDFDPDLFSVIPIVGSSVVMDNNKYQYHAELVPDSTISNNYEIVEILVIIQK